MKSSYLLEQIKQNFPEIRWKKFHVFRHGWDHVTVMLDEKIIFRFPINSEYKKSFKIELKVLNELKKDVNLAIPHYIFVQKDKLFGGYRAIPGVRLTAGRFKILGQKHKIKIAKQLASFLKILHSFSLNKSKQLGIKSSWSFNEAAVELKKHYQEIKSRFNKKENNSLILLIKELSKKIHHFSPVLTHQDLIPEHIYFNPNKKQLNGIIDFGDMQLGDPAVDFSGLWDYGEDFVDLVLIYYKSEDKAIKSRSMDWFMRSKIDLLYYGITMNRPKYYKDGYKIIAERLK